MTTQGPNESPVARLWRWAYFSVTGDGSHLMAFYYGTQAMTQSSNRIFDDISRLATDALGAAQGMRREVETLVKTQVESFLKNMDVATREEADIARELAAKAREEAATLAERVKLLEERIAVLEREKASASK